MWDNRQSKRNPKAPDFKCRDRRCDGVLWPGQHKVAVPIFMPRAQADGPAEPYATEHKAGQGSTRPTGTEGPAPQRVLLRSRYLDVTDFVLSEVRPKYQDAGVPCTDATVAAIAATLFIAACRTEGA
jgi:hypothetical protein